MLYNGSMTSEWTVLRRLFSEKAELQSQVLRLEEELRKRDAVVTAVMKAQRVQGLQQARDFLMENLVDIGVIMMIDEEINKTMEGK